MLSEAILNHKGKGRFRAYSAGSHPTGRVNPYALDLLNRMGLPTDGLRSKSWEEFAVPGAPQIDFIFTVCDNAAIEPCPIWPGHPTTAHWGIPDPAAATGSAAEVALAFKQAYRLLATRIGIFAALPFRSLDKLSLQAKLKEIGRGEGASAKAASSPSGRV